MVVEFISLQYTIFGKIVCDALLFGFTLFGKY